MENLDEQAGLFNPGSLWHKSFLIIIILLAVVVRFDEIQAPGHLLDREYTSAIFARAYYYQSNDSIEQWEKKVAVATMNRQPILEPPLTDLLVAMTYKLVGREEVWISRFMTNSFWLIGAIFFYMLTRLLLPRDPALFATGYYLFVPMGVETSRSFQPDSLMMMTLIMSLYATVRYFQTPSWKWLILAGSVSGAAILLRPLVLFTLLFAFLAMEIYSIRNTKGSWHHIFNKHFVVFCFLALTASVIYYGYGILIADYMNWKVAHSFRPYLFPKFDFWRGWFNLATYVTGQSVLLLALVGFTLLRKGLLKALLMGFMAGYFIFGLVFTYHTHTHPYYHIQLIPLIGICASPIIQVISNIVKKSRNESWQAFAIIAILLSIYFSYNDVRTRLYTKTYENPTVAKEIGEIVKHSSRTVFVAYYYGVPLQYFGEFTGSPWPVAIEDAFYRYPGEEELTVQERIDALGFDPEYFVITHFGLYTRKHQDLKVFLDKNCLLVAKTNSYEIYSSCKTMVSKQ
jgi:hypothetical protein